MILVTGANGLVGSFAVRALLAAGQQVRVLLRPDADLTLLAPVLPTVEQARGDISDVVSLRQALAEIEGVVHAAGLVSYHPDDRSALQHINATGTGNVVNAALDASVSQFVYVSSTAALGDRTGRVVSGASDWRDGPGSTHYGQSKYQGEREAWRGFQEGLGGAILNPSVVLGPGHWHRGSTRLFRYVWEEHTYYGTGKLNYVDVRDLATAILAVLENPGFPPERYVVSAGRTSYRAFFARVAEEWGKLPPRRPAGPVSSALAWRSGWLQQRFTGKRPLVTRETAYLARQAYTYDSSQLRSMFEIDFRPLAETVAWTCQKLLDREEKATSG